MLRTAIFGAGAIGAALAHRLAERSRVREVLVIDGNRSVAEGKTLDIRQSGPIDRSSVILRASDDSLAAVGADVIVLADDTAKGAWEREPGLVLIDRLRKAGSTAPLVFAGPGQLPLMEACARELHIPADRLVATAPSAMESIAASLVHIETGQTGAALTLVGRPPALVVGWTAVTIGGSLIIDRVPAHRLLAISQSLPKLWPPGPQAIAAPTALIVEGLMLGSRRLLSAAVMLDGEFGVRGRAGLVPVELGNGRVRRRVEPSLSPQERTEATTSLMR